MNHFFLFLIVIWSTPVLASTSIDPNECIRLLNKAIELNNISAAEFLVDHLDPLGPTTQSDSTLINNLIKKKAPPALLRKYLSVEANLVKVDLRRLNPVQASLQAQNHEALAILRELGINPTDSSVKFETSLAETRAIIKSLMRLGVAPLTRRAILTQKWKGGVIADPSDPGKSLSLSTLVYEALVKRETALVKYFQSRANEISWLFAHNDEWVTRLGNPYGGAALGPVGHLALRLIQDGGSENVTYLRLMRSLGLKFDFLNVLVLPPPVIVTLFGRPTVMHDSVFESALTGWITHPLARTYSSYDSDPQLTYSVRNRREKRGETVAPRAPDLEMILFLLDEVEYEPELNLPHYFEVLRSPDIAILELFLTHPRLKEMLLNLGIDLFGAALPTYPPRSYGKPEKLIPGGGSTASVSSANNFSPADLEILNRAKIEMIINAGFDPLNSPTLKIWFEEVQNKEKDQAKTRFIFDYLATRGFDFANFSRR